MDPLTIAGLLGSTASGALSIFGQQQQGATQRAALSNAEQAQAQQQLLNQLQIQMAQAPRTDARGNTVFYQPGVGWQTNLSPTTRGIVNASDAMTRANLVNQLTRGEYERQAGFGRRLAEGQAADPLLRALANNYGGPTREGVAGRNAIANVTGAAENADTLRSAYSGAALRTGASSVPIGQTLSSLDKGGTAGIRTALAQSNAQADPLYQAQMKQFQESKLNPYNMLATRAGNSSDVPFRPENLSNSVDASLLSSANTGASKIAGGSDALYRGVVPTMAAFGAQNNPNYDLFAAGVTANIKDLLRGGGGYNNGDPMKFTALFPRDQTQPIF